MRSGTVMPPPRYWCDCQDHGPGVAWLADLRGEMNGILFLSLPIESLSPSDIKTWCRAPLKIFPSLCVARPALAGIEEDIWKTPGLDLVTFITDRDSLWETQWYSNHDLNMEPDTSCYTATPSSQSSVQFSLQTLHYKTLQSYYRVPLSLIDTSVNDLHLLTSNLEMVVLKNKQIYW